MAMLGLVYMLMRARKRPVVSGIEKLVGDTAEVLEDFSGSGNVFLEGERWRAESSVPLNKGQRVRVTGINGLVVQVEPVND